MYLDDYGYHISLMRIQDTYRNEDFKGSLNSDIVYSIWPVDTSGVIEKHGNIIFLFDVLTDEDDKIICIVNEQLSDIYSYDDRIFSLEGKNHFKLKEVLLKIKELYPDALQDLCL